MENQNKLFYRIDACFNVIKNKNFPDIDGVSDHVEMPEGNLRFFAEGRKPNEEKGCWLNEQKDGSVVFGYYDARKNIKNSSLIISTGEEYIREVGVLVKTWFAECEVQ